MHYDSTQQSSLSVTALTSPLTPGSLIDHCNLLQVYHDLDSSWKHVFVATAFCTHLLWLIFFLYLLISSWIVLRHQLVTGGTKSFPLMVLKISLDISPSAHSKLMAALVLHFSIIKLLHFLCDVQPWLNLQLLQHLYIFISATGHHEWCTREKKHRPI